MSGSSGVDANLLAHNISSNIQRITLLTNEIQQMMRHFGTAQDTTILRQTLQEKQQNVNHLAKVTDKYMKDFSALPVTPEQRQRKIQRERLITEFSNALGVLQKVQREVAKKEKEFVERVRASSRVSAGDPNDGFGGIASPFKSFEIQAQTQSYEENFTEEDLQLIQERESAIRQLESDITNINDIFRDLGMMVHEQGDMIDSIEANVSTAEVHVQSATQNLNRAASYQTSFRKKIFIFIAILVVVAVIIGLIVWASQKQ
ncbi:syntaxin-7-like isoform X1 [Pimephales promelas]|uniref:syntaxin-7-like isoform X1 n=1 Tax=Pimephales promelas TaxID=90988 RepID=UPI001955CEA4|nr:syntaxin-7-like isoform X1 [Pimephales promelas]KAG1938431.1 syntaxin-7 [Pimephales promelas]KAG1938432.1 syntaxin-7 [Pimephales promelas]KAG1938433.1 syntaxin-7 [Pimephales promelas]KAG1938434.1 syntaxin-7 [Pimephales promelas]KAG1938435.1 syntaxin-7 [Pimephales promelas]